MDTSKSTNSVEGYNYDDVIRERIKFYKEENAKFESIFTQCGLLHEPSSIQNLDMAYDMHKEIDELAKTVEHFGVTEFDAATLAMAYVEDLSNDNGIKEKLKNETHIFMRLNDELQKDIRRLSRDLDENKKQIQGEFDLSQEDIYVLEKKITAYQNELAKFETKHSWLKNSQLDLTYIAKEAQMLESMIKEKEALEKDLEMYQGLEPDLQIASHQLSLVKKQYQAMKDKLQINN